MKVLARDPDSEKKIIKTDEGLIRLWNGKENVKVFSTEESNEKLALIAVTKWLWMPVTS